MNNSLIAKDYRERSVKLYSCGCDNNCNFVFVTYEPVLNNKDNRKNFVSTDLLCSIFLPNYKKLAKANMCGLIPEYVGYENTDLINTKDLICKKCQRQSVTLDLLSLILNIVKLSGRQGMLNYFKNAGQHISEV